MQVSIFKKSNEDKQYLHTFRTVANPEDNGGESVVVEVDVFDNGDSLYYNTHIETNCYGTSKARISLYGVGFFSLFAAINAIARRLPEGAICFDRAGNLIRKE